MKKLFAFLSIALLALVSISCSREEPIVDDQGQDVVIDDPYKDFPRLESVGLKEDLDTRVTYDGLQEYDSGRIFESHFDAGDDIYIVINGTNGIRQYHYRYVEKNQPWEAVGTKAPYDENADYYAYWSGNGSSHRDLNSYLTVTTLGIDVTTFFKPAMRYWIDNVLNIKSQGSETTFRGQDLLTGKGVEGDGQYTVKFTLHHAMGLACIKKVNEGSISTTKYLSTDSFYRWTETTNVNDVILDQVGSDSFGGCYPYDKGDGWLYLWVAPKEVDATGTTVFSRDFRWSRSFAIGTTKFQRIDILKSGTEPYVLTNGDIFYDNGNLSHSGDVNTQNSSRKPIGIVVSLDKASISGDGNALRDLMNAQKSFSISDSEKENRGRNGNAGTGFHALVLALKDAYYVNNQPATVKWSKNYNNLSGIINISTFNDLKKDMNGYKNTKYVQTLTFTESNYPAFYYVVHFGESAGKDGYLIPGQTTTTGWFMPSAGQWLALSDGVLDSPSSTLYIDNGSPSPDDYGTPIDPDDEVGVGNYVIYSVPKEYIMNKYLTNAGGEDIATSGVVYWTSSEASREYAISYCIGGSVYELAFGWDHEKKGSWATNGRQERVRAMLAF